MSLSNGSPDENSDFSQRATNGLNSSFNKNGRSPQKVATVSNDSRRNGNSLNNNHDEYKVDMKNGNDKVTEDDPLTGRRKWNAAGQSGEAFQPRWRQKFASTKFFMVVFLLAYVLQGCYFTYFVSVITTIEKLFHIKSANIALLLNFSEIGQIFTSLLLTYYAGRGHRPRWIACGMFLFSIAAFGSVSPHFLFGSQLYNNRGMPTNSLALEQHQNPTTSLDSLIGYTNNTLCLTNDEYAKLGEFDPSEFTLFDLWDDN